MKRGNGSGMKRAVVYGMFGGIVPRWVRGVREASGFEV
jgi:hypothetical protein